MGPEIGQISTVPLNTISDILNFNIHWWTPEVSIIPDLSFQAVMEQGSEAACPGLALVTREIPLVFLYLSFLIYEETMIED